MISIGKSIFLDIKVALPITTGTSALGLGQCLNLIQQSDITKIATIVGIVSSIVLLITHSIKDFIEIRKGYLENKKLEMNNEMLEKKIQSKEKKEKE